MRLKLLSISCAALLLAAAQLSGQTCPGWELQSAVGPTGSVGHAMAYHEAAGVTLLYDGLLGPSGRETWTWDGTDWTLRAGVNPSSGGWDAIVYDSARQVCVLFGGQAAGRTLDETWEWDGREWRGVSS